MSGHSLERRHTHPPAPAASGGGPDDANKGQLLAFTPTTKQRAYLAALLEATAAGADTTDRALAKRARAHHTTISHWREDDRFEDWLDEQLRRTFRRGLTRVLLRAYTMALRGSITHMDFFARFSGQAPADGGPSGFGAATDDPTTNYTIINLIPRPPALEALDQTT